MSKVRMFLVSETPTCSADQLAIARQELSYWASHWGYGPLVSVELDQIEDGASAHVEESDGTQVDVTGRFLLHFVGNAA